MNVTDFLAAPIGTQVTLEGRGHSGVIRQRTFIKTGEHGSNGWLATCPNYKGTLAITVNNMPHWSQSSRLPVRPSPAVGCTVWGATVSKYGDIERTRIKLQSASVVES